MIVASSRSYLAAALAAALGLVLATVLAIDPPIDRPDDHRSDEQPAEELPALESEAYETSIRLEPITDPDRMLARQRAIEMARTGCLHSPMPLREGLQPLLSD